MIKMPRVHVDEIVPDVYVLRVDDEETRFFEALWEIPEGITYNAYLVLGGEKNVLIDGWKGSYGELFMETLRRIVEPESIDYIVVNHMEPDHTGTLPLMHASASHAVILGHPLAAKMAGSFYGIRDRIKPVRDLEEVDLGGRRMVFHYTPWLHWPETMMTLLSPDNILFSCDAFGGYSAPPSIYDDGDWETYSYYAKKYLFTVIGAYIDHIAKNLEKLEKRGVKPSIVAPAHGLIFRKNPEKIVKLYGELAAGKTMHRKVAVIYDSMYGFVEEQVYEAVAGLKQLGATVSVHRLVDDYRSTIADFIGEAGDAEAIIVGASTYEAGVFPLIEYVVDIFLKKIRRPKKVLIISSYGWGGVAGKRLAKKFSEAGHEVVAVVENRGKIGEDGKKTLREALARLLEH